MWEGGEIVTYKIAIITGGRDYYLCELELKWLIKYFDENEIDFIFVGDCKTGVDRTIKDKILASRDGAVFCAAWTKYDKGAGPRRNGWMAAFASPHRSVCIAFPGNKGTANMIKRAMALSIPIVMAPQP